jgi:hypothetical protein
MKRLLLLWLFCLPAWASWNYCYPLTYDHTQVGSSDSSSFPALVAFNASAMKDSGHGGDVQSSAGADILFYSDSGLTTQIASQVIYYDNVNGVGWFRVGIGTLSHSSNGTIYMAVGNASPPARTSGVWDANTVAMWPMSNGTAVSGTDVAGSNNLTNYGTFAAGQVDGASSSASANGSDSGLNLGTALRTISAWINVASFNARVMLYGTGSSGERIDFYLDSGTLYLSNYGGDVYFSYAFSTGVWYHVAYGWDGTYGRLYVNGSEIGNYPQSLNTVSSGTIYLNDQGAATLNAVRYSSVFRGADWIKAEYNNENAPGNIGSPGFWTFGARTAPAIARKRTIVVQ